MAYYVTPDEVQEIYIDCPLTDDQIDPYIISAHTYIVDVLSSNTSLSEATKKEIERWLTAHLIASIHSRPASREKVGEAEVEYANAKFGEGLKATPYGQMVLMLDSTGLLGASGKRAASFYVPKSFDE